MGRIDWSHPGRPRFWAPGVVIRFRFKGAVSRVLLCDEVLYGNSHNYVEVTVDGLAYRLQTKGRQDTLVITGHSVRVAAGEPTRTEKAGRPEKEADDAGKQHLVTICKDTESGIGYLEMAGVLCQQLLPPPPLPSRKIEFIGNSITCGAEMDMSVTPCNTGVWYDRHNAWMSYGALTARHLDAQWHLTAVSGIGLIHSCCKMEITMPQIFDKMNQRSDSGAWDLSRYQPDVVTICLGQNDGVQDSVTFCRAYLSFIAKVRGVYPDSRIVCLTSPMGDAVLTTALKRYLGGIVEAAGRAGDPKVTAYFFSRQYSHGCGGHPDLDQHREIAEELTAYLKKLMKW
jgi:GDSL-like Lipase/Acylhydrolase family/Carbohydrate esterase 2 N-terminal